MTLLEKAPAGAEVVVNGYNTLNSKVEAFENGIDEVVISGGDAEVIDDNGETLGLLSEVITRTKPKR